VTRESIALVVDKRKVENEEASTSRRSLFKCLCLW